MTGEAEAVPTGAQQAVDDHRNNEASSSDQKAEDTKPESGKILLDFVVFLAQLRN